MNLMLFQATWPIYFLPPQFLHLAFPRALPWAACLGFARALLMLVHIKHLNENLRHSLSVLLVNLHDNKYCLLDYLKINYFPPSFKKYIFDIM